jgi:hypothetical protein
MCVPLMEFLISFDAKLAKMLLVPHILVCLFQFVQREHLLINDGTDIIGFDCTVHVLELHSRADKHPTDRAYVVQAIKE